MVNQISSPFPLTVDLSLLSGKFLLGSLLEMVHILCRVSHSNTKHSRLMFCKDKLLHNILNIFTNLHRIFKVGIYIVDGWKTGRCRRAVIAALMTVVITKRPPTVMTNTLLLLKKKRQNGIKRVINLVYMLFGMMLKDIDIQSVNVNQQRGCGITLEV